MMMLAAAMVSALAAFTGSTVTQTLSTDARTPSNALVAALSNDDEFRNSARYAHLEPSAFIRRHFATTAIQLNSGATLLLVRVVIRGMDAGWCGANNCPFQIWTRRHGTYVKVLSESGQQVAIFQDGSAEIAGHASAFTEDYRTFGWTGVAFGETGYFDNQGNHANLPAAKTIAFDPGNSSATISGYTRGDEPGEPYDFTARAGQLVSITLFDGAKTCKLAIDRGRMSYVIGSGSSLTYRVPQDGRYTLVVLRNGLDLSSFSFEIVID